MTRHTCIQVHLKSEILAAKIRMTEISRLLLFTLLLYIWMPSG